jgi:hypothetical protein
MTGRLLERRIARLEAARRMREGDDVLEVHYVDYMHDPPEPDEVIRVPMTATDAVRCPRNAPWASTQKPLPCAPQLEGTGTPAPPAPSPPPAPPAPSNRDPLARPYRLVRSR